MAGSDPILPAGGQSRLGQRVFGVYASALQLRAERAELLSQNLANANTPNFKARDFDFHAVLASAAADAQRGDGPLPFSHAPELMPAGSHPAHLDLSESRRSFALGYRIPGAASLDGNTVDSQMEKTAFADNALQYRLTLDFLSSRVKNAMRALSGDE